jgi:hypothetical protein
MKKCIVLSAMLIGVCMTHAMDDRRGGKEEAPRLSPEDFQFPHSSHASAMKRHAEFYGQTLQSVQKNTQIDASPKRERKLP